MILFAVLRDKAKGHMSNLLCGWPRDRLSDFNTALGHFKLRDSHMGNIWKINGPSNGEILAVSYKSF